MCHPPGMDFAFRARNASTSSNLSFATSVVAAHSRSRSERRSRHAMDAVDELMPKRYYVPLIAAKKTVQWNGKLRRGFSGVMILFITMPLWLGIPIWILIAIANRKATPSTALVSRTITAPDGRVVTMLVPANELLEVSIAKLYPNGEIPQVVPRLASATAEAQSQVTPRLAAPLSEIYPVTPRVPPTRDQSSFFRRADGYFRTSVWLGGVVIVIGIFIALFAPSGPATPPPQSVMAPTPFRGQQQTGQQQVTPVAKMVRVKTKSNIRTGAGTAFPVVRTANAGETFLVITQSLGWAQIEGGWIAMSQVE
jgi:hypothetical protein